MFIQTEATPNPATLKFLPGRDVLVGEPTRFPRCRGLAISPLAQRLFAMPGVTGVFLGSDFISVTKDVTEWNHIKPAILGVIMEHFLSGQPVLSTEGRRSMSETTEDEFFDPDDAATVEVIKELLATRVRPAVAMDGGDITFRGFKEGTVYLHMQGACSGCPSSTATLKSGIENLISTRAPSVPRPEALFHEIEVPDDIGCGRWDRRAPTALRPGSSSSSRARRRSG
jgi:Fe-S cluster biogenesis protein NfuA